MIIFQFLCVFLAEPKFNFRAVPVPLLIVCWCLLPVAELALNFFRFLLVLGWMNDACVSEQCITRFFQLDVLLWSVLIPCYDSSIIHFRLAKNTCCIMLIPKPSLRYYEADATARSVAGETLNSTVRINPCQLHGPPGRLRLRSLPCVSLSMQSSDL